MRLRRCIPFALVAGCATVEPAPLESGETDLDDIPCPALPCATLSEYGFFASEPAEMDLVDDVHPYEPSAPLWSDNAEKLRFFQLPGGSQAVFASEEEWVWPEGSILVKHFGFRDDLRDAASPMRHVETRLLIREEGDWTGHVYLWRDDQSDADRHVAGKRVEVTYTDLAGERGSHTYLVPNTNQCESCHGRDDTQHTLGLVTPQLNIPVVRDGERVEQLEWLAQRGVFSGPLPPSADLSSLAGWHAEDIEEAARSYLHANCSHCHRQGGTAGKSGLELLYWTEDPKSYGVCKEPAAAGGGTGGRSYDIYPGSPEDSIIPYRMASTDPDEKMPELPQMIPHEHGIELVSEWIRTLDHPPCD